jgi:hypothetical protein
LLYTTKGVEPEKEPLLQRLSSIILF